MAQRGEIVVFIIFKSKKKKKKVLWSEQRGDMGNENYLFG